MLLFLLWSLTDQWWTCCNVFSVKVCIPFNEFQFSVAWSYTDWCAHSNATALTVDSIITVLRGIGWSRICRYILNLPDSKCDETRKQFSNNEDRVRAGVKEWMLRDPVTSWRRLIHQLYDYSEAGHIVHYAEELTGMYTTWCMGIAQARKSLLYMHMLQWRTGSRGRFMGTPLWAGPVH